MKVRFLADVLVLTRTYPPGHVLELDERTALRLIRNKHAEAAAASEPETETEPEARGGKSLADAMFEGMDSPEGRAAIQEAIDQAAEDKAKPAPAPADRAGGKQAKRPGRPKAK